MPTVPSKRVLENGLGGDPEEHGSHRCKMEPPGTPTASTQTNIALYSVPVTVSGSSRTNGIKQRRPIDYQRGQDEEPSKLERLDMELLTCHPMHSKRHESTINAFVDRALMHNPGDLETLYPPAAEYFDRINRAFRKQGSADNFIGGTHHAMMAAWRRRLLVWIGATLDSPSDLASAVETLLRHTGNSNRVIVSTETIQRVQDILTATLPNCDDSEADRAADPLQDNERGQGIPPVYNGAINTQESAPIASCDFRDVERAWEHLNPDRPSLAAAAVPRTAHGVRRDGTNTPTRTSGLQDASATSRTLPPWPFPPHKTPFKCLEDAEKTVYVVAPLSFGKDSVARGFLDGLGNPRVKVKDLGRRVYAVTFESVQMAREHTGARIQVQSKWCLTTQYPVKDPQVFIVTVAASGKYGILPEDVQPSLARAFPMIPFHLRGEPAGSASKLTWVVVFARGLSLLRFSIPLQSRNGTYTGVWFEPVSLNGACPVCSNGHSALGCDLLVPLSHDCVGAAADDGSYLPETPPLH